MPDDRMLIPLVLLLVSLSLASCDAAKPDEAAIQTWTLREDWRVGGEIAGPHSFDANFGLAMLPGDSLLHFDYQEQRFHVLDLSGNGIRSFGRKGPGPGETDGNGFAISPSGVIVVNDRGNDRLSRFDTEGAFLGSVPVQWQFTTGVNWNARFLEDGRLFDHQTTVADSMGARVWIDRIRLWSRNIKSFEDLDLRSCMISPRPAAGHSTIATSQKADAVVGLLPLPFSGPWFATAIDPAGYIWGVPPGDSLTIEKFPVGACKAVASITLANDVPLIPASTADSALEALAGFATASGGSLPAETKLPGRFPPFWTLHVDDQHQLWAQRFGPAGERVMEVYDSTGAPVARVNNFPLEPRWPLVFHRDRIYGFAADQDGIKYLVALSLLR
ncbi:MAG TPA: hypothetical protein PLL69_06490 [Gemmatimonadales bacterium]|nr:hypothetical protein [Gemmatimonadales bacterium]